MTPTPADAHDLLSRLEAQEERLCILEALQAGRRDEDARTRALLAELGRALEGWTHRLIPEPDSVRMAVVLGGHVDSGDVSRLQMSVDAWLRGGK